MAEREFRVNEIGSIYVDGEDRYVVSLVVGYQREHLDDCWNDEFTEASAPYLDDATAVKYAAFSALEITRSDGCEDTRWMVYDRTTGVTTWLEEREFTHLNDNGDWAFGPFLEGE